MQDLDETRIRTLLNRAAHEGAKKALSDIGLSDGEAGQDIHDLRKLLDDWRSCKRTVFTTLIKAVTMGVLGFIAATVWLKIGD